MTLVEKYQAAKIKKLKLHYEQVLDAENKCPQWHWAYKTAAQNAEWGLWLINIIEGKNGQL